MRALPHFLRARSKHTAQAAARTRKDNEPRKAMRSGVHGCTTCGTGLYHVWDKVVPRMGKGCTTYGKRLYHVWEKAELNGVWIETSARGANFSTENFHILNLLRTFVAVYSTPHTGLTWI